MNKHVDIQTEAVEKELGVGLQFSVTVGQGRQIAMTAGFPLEWSGEKIDVLLDKLAKSMDRQAALYEIRDRELAIDNMKAQILTQQEQKQNFLTNLEAQHYAGGRRGEFKPHGDQVVKLNTYETNIKGLRAAIEKYEKDLKEAKERCR